VLLKSLRLAEQAQTFFKTVAIPGLFDLMVGGSSEQLRTIHLEVIA
jgi:hypothetical protein